MIKINIPNNNINERRYILDIIFDDFLGLEYNIVESSDYTNWEIELDNKSKLIIEDHFFSKALKNLDYLKVENIPSNVKFVFNKFIVEKDIPVIFGNSALDIKNTVFITCGIDIFASSFFMLTRWEEYVNNTRDKHDRFPAIESLAYKNGFLDRPIVNEYLEMLKNMLLSLDNNIKFKLHTYKLLLTHDVDHIYKWDTAKKFLRHLAGDLLIRKSIKEFFYSLWYYVNVKLKLKKDPYDNFEYLMDLSEKIGIKSYFFFMAEGLTNFDNRYKTNSSEVLSLVNKIKNRSHNIGIHPTYNTYNNSNQLEKEKLELENRFELSIVFGREHYLRFDIPTTWQIWNDNGMEWDSTCGFSNKEGFRCGVCFEYKVFNILTQKKLRLKEKPLIVMDGSIYTQKNMTKQRMQSIIKDLLLKVQKYNGEFVFLWHNSSFNVKEWREFENIYHQVILTS